MGHLQVSVRRCHQVNQYRYAIESDQGRYGLNAANQNLIAKGEAYIGADLRNADTRKKQAKAGSDEALDQIAFRKR